MDPLAWLRVGGPARRSFEPDESGAHPGAAMGPAFGASFELMNNRALSLSKGGLRQARPTRWRTKPLKHPCPEPVEGHTTGFDKLSQHDRQQLKGLMHE